MIKEILSGSDTGGDLVTARIDYLAAMIALGANDEVARVLWRGDRATIGQYEINLVPSLCLWIRDGERVIRVNDIQRWIPPDQDEATSIYLPDQIAPNPPQRWEWIADRDYEAITGASSDLAVWSGEIARSVDAALGIAKLPRHWRDGTGRVAGAVLDRIATLDDIHKPPSVLDNRIATAYVGGRISIHQAGRWDRITQIDLRSAYPWAMTQLPSMDGALWIKRTQYEPGAPWALWRVFWDVPEGAISGPLPVRTAGGAIAYPLSGAGWYWSPEVAAAIECYGGMIRVDDGFQIVPRDDSFRPFAPLSDLYRHRRQLARDGEIAAAHVAKLALTSCYGRLAQAVQHNGKPGRWGNLALAGLTTAMVRGRMMRSLWEHESTAIAIATDSLTVSGEIDERSTDALGGWKVESGTDALMFPSGVFRVNSGEAAMERMSGVERARAMQVDWPMMYDGWEKLGLALSYKVAVPTFQGIGMAGATDQWAKFGRWRIYRHELVGHPNHAKPVRVGNRTWRLMPSGGERMIAARYVPRAAVIGRTDDQVRQSLTDTAREHDQPMG